MFLVLLSLIIVQKHIAVYRAKDNMCSAVHHTAGGLSLKNSPVFVYILQMSARIVTLAFVIVDT